MLQSMGFRSCSSLALEHRLNGGARALVAPGMQELPGPGIEPMSSALAGRFFYHQAIREALQPILKKVKGMNFQRRDR